MVSTVGSAVTVPATPLIVGGRPAGVAAAKNGTTTGPFVPAAPLWICAANGCCTMFCQLNAKCTVVVPTWKNANDLPLGTVAGVSLALVATVAKFEPSNASRRSNDPNDPNDPNDCPKNDPWSTWSWPRAAPAGNSGVW